MPRIHKVLRVHLQCSGFEKSGKQADCCRSIYNDPAIDGSSYNSDTPKRFPATTVPIDLSSTTATTTSLECNRRTVKQKYRFGIWLSICDCNDAYVRTNNMLFVSFQMVFLVATHKNCWLGGGDTQRMHTTCRI